MLSPTIDTVRLFIHVLAASIWVGGQIALAGIVPALRQNHPESTKTVARAFGKVAWASYVIVVISGIWSLIEVDVTNADWSYTATVMVHVFAAAAAGAAAAVHAIGRTKIAIALGGALGLIASLIALFIGLLLRTGR